MCKSWGLPEKGDKRTLEKLHREYVIRFNAQVDRGIPRSEADIRSQVSSACECLRRHRVALSHAFVQLSLYRHRSPADIPESTRGLPSSRNIPCRAHTRTLAHAHARTMHTLGGKRDSGRAQERTNNASGLQQHL
jgi:hypothetical protein